LIALPVGPICRSAGNRPLIERLIAGLRGCRARIPLAKFGSRTFRGRQRMARTAKTQPGLAVNTRRRKTDGKDETTLPAVPVLRIFLSSPGDVAAERTIARELIEGELAKRPAYRGLKLEVIAWDDPNAHIPMLANETPQASVNAARPRPATCDIVIVILWSRMGTPLPDSIRKPNGEPYLSGTEWEYEDAVNSPREPRPQVLLYRRTEKPTIALDDPQWEDKRAQYARVAAFFAQFRNSDGSLKGLNASAPSDEARPTIAEIPSEYLAWLKRACADVSLLGQDIQKGHAFTLGHVYVPALTRPASGSPPQKKDRWKRHEASEEQKPIPLLRRLDRQSLYVPAPAGAGKSTFCRWAVLQSIGDALLDRWDLQHVGGWSAHYLTGGAVPWIAPS
jgi:hypothetical protein